MADTNAAPATSSGPASVASNDALVSLSEQAFNNVGKYLQAELSITREDYRLLDSMNKLSKDKYAELTALAASLNVSMAALHEKYASLLPFLEQIDQIETNLTVLEQATKEIDDYSKRLEAKFKKVLGTK